MAKSMALRSQMRYGQQKMGTVMSEYKAGKLHSGSKNGPLVKNQKQAVAIGLSYGKKGM